MRIINVRTEYCRHCHNRRHHRLWRSRFAEVSFLFFPPNTFLGLLCTPSVAVVSRHVSRTPLFSRRGSSGRVNRFCCGKRNRVSRTKRTYKVGRIKTSRQVSKKRPEKSLSLRDGKQTTAPPSSISYVIERYLICNHICP